MWRVYAICRNPKPTMSKTVSILHCTVKRMCAVHPSFPLLLQLIKDYHLMLLVLAFVVVDTIILIVVMSLDNSRFTVTTIPNKQDPSPHINVGSDASVRACVHACRRVCVHAYGV